ncbi:hypothetical protein XU18_2169 [Perkinsela sp. CCAP 1560/4]|nr:hypothetical protein XU18_2169 [Perkinsela sp. CCAP 1560/4]|eukprot:KNH07124.1 hypothetical protein XU18_2169 [Perkinsela sp. CCAP 1560/4]
MNETAYQLTVFGVDARKADTVRKAIEKSTGYPVKRVLYPPKPYHGFFMIELALPEHMRQCMEMHLQELLPLQYIGIILSKTLPLQEELLPEKARHILRRNEMEHGRKEEENYQISNGFPMYSDFDSRRLSAKASGLSPYPKPLTREFSLFRLPKEILKLLGASVLCRWPTCSKDLQGFLIYSALVYFAGLVLTNLFVPTP